MACRPVCGGPVLCILDNVEGVSVVDSWARETLASVLYALLHLVRDPGWLI